MGTYKISGVREVKCCSLTRDLSIKGVLHGHSQGRRWVDHSPPLLNSPSTHNLCCRWLFYVITRSLCKGPYEVPLQSDCVIASNTSYEWRGSSTVLVSGPLITASVSGRVIRRIGEGVENGIGVFVVRESLGKLCVGLG